MDALSILKLLHILRHAKALRIYNFTFSAHTQLLLGIIAHYFVLFLDKTSWQVFTRRGHNFKKVTCSTLYNWLYRNTLDMQGLSTCNPNSDKHDVRNILNRNVLLTYIVHLNEYHPAEHAGSILCKPDNFTLLYCARRT